jgi:hypothetical protein
VRCPGSLIFRADGTVAGRTEDDEADGCVGRDVAYDGDPVRCYVWLLGGCNYFRVQAVQYRSR